MAANAARFEQQQRPPILTRHGDVVDVAAWLENPDERLGELPTLDIVFAPLPGEEADAATESIAHEVAQYLKESLRLKARPDVSFSAAGMLGGVCYWVYQCAMRDAPPLYGFLIRNSCVAEMSCGDCDVADDDGRVHRLTPPQAAFWEYVQGDWEVPRA